MPPRPGPDEREDTTVPFRRRFLAAATLAATATAGCSTLASRHFEATRVRLPDRAQRRLLLGPTTETSVTTRREVDAGPFDTEMTITSEVAAYTRARGVADLGDAAGGAVTTPSPSAVLSPLERWLRRRTDVAGVGAAVVVPAARLGIETTRTTDLVSPTGDSVGAPGGHTSVVVPGGHRGDTLPAGDFLTLQRGRAFSTERVRVRSDGPTPRMLDVAEFFPSHTPALEVWTGTPSLTRWFPASTGDVTAGPEPSFDPANASVLVIPGATGPSEQDLETGDGALLGRPLDAGEPVDLSDDVLVASPADRLLPTDTVAFHGLGDAPRGTVEAAPAPVQGATFGTGVVATPRASVAGQAQNPAVDTPIRTLLTREESRRVLRRAGVPAASSVSWVDGPVALPDDAATDHGTVAWLGQDSPLQTFLGTLVGDGEGDDPWGVAVHATRVELEDDVAIAVGVQRTPMVRGGSLRTAARRQAVRRWIRNGRTYTGLAISWLARGDP